MIGKIIICHFFACKKSSKYVGVSLFLSVDCASRRDAQSFFRIAEMSAKISNVVVREIAGAIDKHGRAYQSPQ